MFGAEVHIHNASREQNDPGRRGEGLHRWSTRVVALEQRQQFRINNIAPANAGTVPALMAEVPSWWLGLCLCLCLSIWAILDVRSHLESTRLLFAERTGARRGVGGPKFPRSGCRFEDWDVDVLMLVSVVSSLQRGGLTRGAEQTSYCLAASGARRIHGGFPSWGCQRH